MFVLQMEPGGVPVNILFDQGVPQKFIDSVQESWQALEPYAQEVNVPDFSVSTALVSPRDFQELQAEWDGQNFKKVTYLNFNEEHPDIAQERLTVEVTLCMLEQLSGKVTLLHAAALGDLETKEVALLIGPSGRGKTTASRYLGKHFAYLSDETAVVAPDFSLRSYPKPLSVILEEGQPKKQISPATEQIQVVRPGNREYSARFMIILDRQEGIEQPYLERVNLADALLSTVSETSGLKMTDEGIENYLNLINHCQGVMRLRYTEISDTLGLFQDLFAGKNHLPAAPVETFEIVESHTSHDEGHLGSTFLQREDQTSLIYVGDDRTLMTSGSNFMEINHLAGDIWLRLAEPKNNDDLRKELVDAYGEVEEDEYNLFIDSLRQAKILK